MTTPAEHHDNKVEVLRLLRSNWQHLKVTGARQGLDWDVAEMATGIGRTELTAVLAELMAIGLATPGPNVSAPVALQTGEVEITTEGLGYLHNLETQQAMETFRMLLGEKAAARQRADVKSETEQTNLKPPVTRSQPPGFRPES